MNIIKYFISLLIIFIIEINYSPYNHLDLQLASLIQSVDDHNGNIVRDKNGDYLKIDISSKNNVKCEVNITDIIPVFAEIKEKYKNDPA